MIPRGDDTVMKTRRIPSVKKTLRAVLFVVVFDFILAGAWRGEIRTVFLKAARICLECIGIG